LFNTTPAFSHFGPELDFHPSILGSGQGKPSFAAWSASLDQSYPLTPHDRIDNVSKAPLSLFTTDARINVDMPTNDRIDLVMERIKRVSANMQKANNLVAETRYAFEGASNYISPAVRLPTGLVLPPTDTKLAPETRVWTDAFGQDVIYGYSQPARVHIARPAHNSIGPTSSRQYDLTSYLRRNTRHRDSSADTAFTEPAMLSLPGTMTAKQVFVAFTLESSKLPACRYWLDLIFPREKERPARTTKAEYKSEHKAEYKSDFKSEYKRPTIPYFNAAARSQRVAMT